MHTANNTHTITSVPCLPYMDEWVWLPMIKFHQQFVACWSLGDLNSPCNASKLHRAREIEMDKMDHGLNYFTCSRWSSGGAFFLADNDSIKNGTKEINNWCYLLFTSNLNGISIYCELLWVALVILFSALIHLLKFNFLFPKSQGSS
jgi:hypothetical protein